MSESLEVLLVQPELVAARPAANRAALRQLATPEAELCDLVVFPETFTTGFLADSETEDEGMDGPTVQWMTQCAQDWGAAVCGSVDSKSKSRDHRQAAGSELASKQLRHLQAQRVGAAGADDGNSRAGRDPAAAIEERRWEAQIEKGLGVVIVELGEDTGADGVDPLELFVDNFLDQRPIVEGSCEVCFRNTELDGRGRQITPPVESEPSRELSRKPADRLAWDISTGIQPDELAAVGLVFIHGK